MNKTIKLLIFSDIFVLTGLGLISPILAIFIKDNLIGGSITSVGIAAMIFVSIKATLQLLFAKIFNPRDRFWMVILGTFLVACAPFIYIFSTFVWHLYIAQAVYGLGAAFAYPAFLSLFTTNLTKGHEGFEWSIYSSCVGIGAAIAAFVGANIAQHFGFRTTFLITGIMAVIGGMILLDLEKKYDDRLHKFIYLPLPHTLKHSPPVK